MTRLNENPHRCLAFRNLNIESRYLICFLKVCIDIFVSCGGGGSKHAFPSIVLRETPIIMTSITGKTKEYFASQKIQEPFNNNKTDNIF